MEQLGAFVLQQPLAQDGHPCHALAGSRQPPDSLIPFPITDTWSCPLCLTKPPCRFWQTFLSAEGTAEVMAGAASLPSELSGCSTEL